MSVIIYGASDDLVEVSGDITEEWGWPHAGRDRAYAYLAMSNGCVFSITYNNDGFWRIAPVIVGRAASYAIALGDDEDTNYSDRLTVDDVTWVALSGDVAR